MHDHGRATNATGKNLPRGSGVASSLSVSSPEEVQVYAECAAVALSAVIGRTFISSSRDGGAKGDETTERNAQPESVVSSLVDKSEDRRRQWNGKAYHKSPPSM